MRQVTSSGVVLAAISAVGFSTTFAPAGAYYYGGYNTATNTQGTPNSPVTGNFVVPGQVTFFADPNGTTPYAAGTGPTASDATTEIYLGALPARRRTPPPRRP